VYKTESAINTQLKYIAIIIQNDKKQAYIHQKKTLTNYIFGTFF
jgi:hypothetical protein